MILNEVPGSAALSNLGRMAHPVAQRIEQLTADGFLERFYNKDVSLWTDLPSGQAEARRRLGWMLSPQKAATRLPEYLSFADEIHATGITKYLVLGMGGSSLASEVLGSVFGSAPGIKGNRLGILDSTDPAQVAQAARDFPPETSLYIVSSKSGGTAEVVAAFEYLWSLAKGEPSHFIAITDADTSLQALAREKGFRAVFTADADVGGRYSALTEFGMIPAALLGIDLDRFLATAAAMQAQCGPDQSLKNNPGAALGVFLGEASLQGFDKLTLLADDRLASLPNWIEQLVAESSGKDGKGILPVALEPVDVPAVYGSDRIFVYLRQTGELDSAVRALRHAGFPSVTLDVQDEYGVAAEFFRWEVAIATACHIIGVNAFDQPDVQESKDRTQAKIAALEAGGRLDEGRWDLDLLQRSSLHHGLAGMASFLKRASAGDYVAINAYLPRRDDVSTELRRLRILLRERTHLATTVGFGPRFQHSTGQLHKGGRNSGLFIQIVSEPELELAIPGRGMTFGSLIRAQALGDYETLLARERRVIRVRLTQPADLALLRRSLDEQFA